MTSGDRLYRALRIGALIAAGAAASMASAAAPPEAAGAAWGLPQLMRGMAQVKSESRRYTEKKYLKVLTAPLVSSGVLVYRAPGHLEKLTLQPRKESMVLDQGIIEIVEPSRHLRRTLMATQYPAVAALVESMRATLAGDADALTRYYRVTVQGASAHWRLQLVPTEAAAREVVREIRIEGRAQRITGIEIVGVDGDRTVMTIGDALPPDGKPK